MLRIESVIPAKVWKHKKTGMSVSIYGAVPWWHECQMVDWDMVQVGWTWQLNDGRIGLGRLPVETMEEAIEVMNLFNERT